MVSLRRRKLLGLCSGRSSFLAPLPRFLGNGTTPANSTQNIKPVSVHPVPSDDADHQELKTSVKVGPGSSNASGSSFSSISKSSLTSKLQAAIKVDKKQIHLGTVGSQEEAARLYDRAAFMCGREPNFELSEKEKEELRKFKWDEFLAMTRHAITNKKHRRRLGGESEKGSEPPTLQNGDWDVKHEADALSASEDVEPDTSAS
ncbi:hypothetical protein FNV43_RR23037 [Rhamnella rubrinervis]|uniref:AP2/ERF domain-containing protein n=1 Tax=Rhamnella rubrinervis TaxID=2594499 RepID=A0A8K0DY66_9ROSA|nr:hypothetical protein FNV43_RR23037 [Rhamnella rubrinervis]